MKRFWLVLLSLGLVLAFSASAMAVDVKFSGDFYVAGMYLDKTKLVKDTAADGPSTAFYYQRLRVRTDFVVSPGLTLITRFDALERVWGGQRSDPTSTTLALDSAGTRAENENIAFDWAYINYVSPIGTFEVGYMNDGATGTVFGDSSVPAGRIRYYSIPFGSFTLKADITKVKDQSYSAVTATSNFTDADDDKYGVEGVYEWKGGKAGMKVTYYRYADKRPQIAPPPLSYNYEKKYFLFTPYAIAKIGPVDIQAEVNYASGSLKEYDSSIVGKDVRLDNLSAFLDATATFGQVYFGGTFAYVSGDDPGSTDRQEGGTLTGGRDWMPCLIMWNYDRTNWAGALNGYNTAAQDTNMSNAWFFQGRAGVRPVAALDIMASVSYANADKKPTAAWLHNSYGWEVDVTGTYKITNNLSYMLGVGYLFTGDYYKGTSDLNQLTNDYILINKLTLTF